MPLVRVSILKGKPPEYRHAILNNIYQAMRDAFNVPEEDRFLVLDQHEEGDFMFSSSYLDIPRTSDLIMIQITANNTRTLEQKQALYARIAELLSQNPGVRPEDILINLVEVPKENWSFGRGIAQYA
jgi:phenylpyruvate tautomerase PptA (4-oxalocrotonate tautomerase family)